MDINDTLTIGQAARLAKVTVRTLHHYDAIGLLSPTLRSSGDYRLYAREDLHRLQQIRLYRSTGMSLESIRQVLDDPGFDERDALREHRRRLEEELSKTRELIRTVDRMLSEGTTMAHEEMFEGFKHEDYAEEVKERWGDTESFKVSAKRTAKYSSSEMQAIKAEHAEILKDFGAAKSAGVEPTEDGAIELAERARRHIDRWFYPLSREGHVQLAQMYTSDPRFRQAYEDVGEGLAEYVVLAIAANADRG